MKKREPDIEERTRGLLRYDPGVKFRASMLPLVRTQQDKVELGYPQMLIDLAEAVMLPGHVAQGGSYTPQDVTKMAADTAMMAAPVGMATAPKGALAMGGTGRKGADDYRGSHTAPMREPGVKNTLDDAVDMFGGDEVYKPKVSVQYFGTGDDILDRQTAAIIAKARNNPDAEIKIYRAVPKGVKEINPGDWVTINKQYADMHGGAHIDGDYDVIEQVVKASDLATDGNSIHEWGYSPRK